MKQGRGILLDQLGTNRFLGKVLEVMKDRHECKLLAKRKDVRERMSSNGSDAFVGSFSQLITFRSQYCVYSAGIDSVKPRYT